MLSRGRCAKWGMLALVVVAAASAGRAETIRCNDTKDVWVSALPKEQNASMGKTDVLKLKVLQELALMGFDALYILIQTSVVFLFSAQLLNQTDTRVQFVLETLVMLGAGELAPHLAMAHATVRPSLQRILIWNRTAAGAEAMAKRLAGEPATRNCSIAPTDDLEAAIRKADLVSAATMTKTPLIRGDWLKPGTHVDLVGGFRPDMRCACRAMRLSECVTAGN